MTLVYGGARAASTPAPIGLRLPRRVRRRDPNGAGRHAPYFLLAQPYTCYSCPSTALNDQRYASIVCQHHRDPIRLYFLFGNCCALCCPPITSPRQTHHAGARAPRQALSPIYTARSPPSLPSHQQQQQQLRPLLSSLRQQLTTLIPTAVTAMETTTPPRSRKRPRVEGRIRQCKFFFPRRHSPSTFYLPLRAHNLAGPVYQP